MPKHLLRYVLIPWITLLIAAPYIAGFFYDADIVWDVDKIATKILVIILLICLTSKDWTFHLLLGVVSLITIYQICDILAVDFKPLLHLVGYNG